MYRRAAVAAVVLSIGCGRTVVHEDARGREPSLTDAWPRPVGLEPRAVQAGVLGALLSAPEVALPGLTVSIGGMATLVPAASAGEDGGSDPPPVGDDPSCSPGMVLVEGESCWGVSHKCLAWAPNDPGMRCLEFEKGKDECLPPKRPLRFCMDRYEWPGVVGAKPRVLTSYFEAEQACHSVGKRMCGEQEFYLACEGPEHWPFAWGHVRHPSTCNIDRPYTMVDWAKWASGGAPGRLEEAKRLDQALPIGASKCWSPYGIHDIAGNVDEWTTAQAGRELQGSLNGGYWGPVPNACRYVTLVHGPEFAFYQIGFRCCSDPKAGSPARP